MLVSSLTKLHTPCQTLSFSAGNKEQPLFKSVSRLNPVFQLILTVTIVIVNMGWNRGFSLVADLNKGFFWLTLLNLNVWQGVCSFCRLDTNILIGTSVLNCQTLETLVLQIKTILWRELGGIIFFLYMWAKYEPIWSDFTAQTVTLGANLLVMARIIPQNAHRELFFGLKVAFSKDI